MECDDWTVQNFDKLALVVDKTIELGNKQRAQLRLSLFTLVISRSFLCLCQGNNG
jgi:hypothetical protein